MIGLVAISLLQFAFDQGYSFLLCLHQPCPIVLHEYTYDSGIDSAVLGVTSLAASSSQTDFLEAAHSVAVAAVLAVHRIILLLAFAAVGVVDCQRGSKSLFVAVVRSCLRQRDL